MSKHTPPPWFVVAEDGADFTAIAKKPSIDSQMDLDCEVLGSSEWLRVKPADLQLMAAAPELLDALIQMVDYYGTHSANVDSLFSAREAIAKATGIKP